MFPYLFFIYVHLFVYIYIHIYVPTKQNLTHSTQVKKNIYIYENIHIFPFLFLFRFWVGFGWILIRLGLVWKVCFWRFGLGGLVCNFSFIFLVGSSLGSPKTNFLLIPSSIFSIYPT